MSHYDECLTELLILSNSGFGFSKLMQFSHRKGLIDREAYVSQYLALSLFTIGLASTLGSDDLLAAFAAGWSLDVIAL